jgi:hypothetical protein
MALNFSHVITTPRFLQLRYSTIFSVLFECFLQNAPPKYGGCTDFGSFSRICNKLWLISPQQEGLDTSPHFKISAGFKPLFSGLFLLPECDSTF